MGPLGRGPRYVHSPSSWTSPWGTPKNRPLGGMRSTTGSSGSSRRTSTSRGAEGSGASPSGGVPPSRPSLGKGVTVGPLPAPSPLMSWATSRDPFGYTFRQNGYPKTDSFYTNPGKVEAIRNTDVIDPMILSPDCGFIYTNVLAN